jgi:hypothetical protein
MRAPLFNSCGGGRRDGGEVAGTSRGRAFAGLTARASRRRLFPGTTSPHFTGRPAFRDRSSSMSRRAYQMGELNDASEGIRDKKQQALPTR